MNRSLLRLIMVVGMLASGVSAAHAVPAPIANSDQACLIRVVASDARTRDGLGAHVAMSHETMVALADGGGRDGRGEAAYVYERSSEGWTQHQKLSFSDLGDEAQPRCVAVDGDTIAVGLPGMVQVWVRMGWTWRLQAQVTDAANDEVSSVAIDGDTMVVGALQAKEMELDGELTDPGPGAVYVFTREGETWTLQQKLAGEGTRTYSFFGNSVDIQGDALAVGAPGEYSPTRGAGAAYVFRRTETGWQQESRLTVPGAPEFASLGGNVQLDGEQLATSMYGWADQTGAVYIWQRASESWTASERLVAPDGRPGYLRDYGGDSFGCAMSLAGDTLVVGAQEDDDKGSNSGSVYILKKVDGTWVFNRKIVPSVTSVDALFGSSIAVDSGRVAVGMPRDDSPLDAAGAIYAFDLGLMTPVDTTLTIAPSDILANDAVPDPAAVDVVQVAAPVNGVLESSPDGGFTYTPSGAWKGTDLFLYRLDFAEPPVPTVLGGIGTAGVADSAAATVTIQTWQPTKALLTASHTTPTYAGSTTLKTTMTTLNGAPIAGRTVTFEVLSGTVWKSVGSAKTGSTGLATVKVASLTTRHTYRARTSFSPVFGAAGSAALVVTPHVAIGRPSVPTLVRRNRSFTTTGILKPRHSSGSKAVQLNYYRYEGGAWVLKTAVWAKASNYSSYSRYSAAVTLTKSGSWKVRAYHPAGSTNAATWSSTRLFTVR